MFNNTRAIKPLLIAGIAGAAYYAYTRLSEDQKKNLMDAITKQGKDLIGGLFGASVNGASANGASANGASTNANAEAHM